MNNIQINNIYLSAADIKSGMLKDVFSDHSDISREEQDSIESFLLDWFSENDFVEVRTSGSTGEPKVISMKKQTMINSASATIKYFDLKAGDKVLLPLSVNYIAGKMMMVRAIVGGLNLRIVAAKSNPLKSLNEIFKFSAMVPLQIEKIISDNKEDNFDMIEKIIIGGAPLKDSLKNTLVKSSCDFYETYGMTETASHVALKNIKSSSDNCFEALENIKFSVDRRNCLVVDAPKLHDKQLVTNDVVDLIDDRHFRWLGRFDNVINSGAVKLFPEEIEKKIAHFIHDRFYITSEKNELLGDSVVLVIESSVNKYDLENKLLNRLESCLDKYEMPRRIVFYEKFKETHTGKIKRELF